jgi:hypothetical protein
MNVLDPINFDKSFTVYYQSTQVREEDSLLTEPVALISLSQCRQHHGLGIAVVMDRDRVAALQADARTNDGKREQLLCLCDTFLHTLGMICGEQTATTLMAVVLAEWIAEQTDPRRN